MGIMVTKVLLYLHNAITTLVHGIMVRGQAGILVVDHVVILSLLSETTEDPLQSTHELLGRMMIPWKIQQKNGL
jgi:hypothetical protein